MTKNTPDNREKVAAEFLRILKLWFSLADKPLNVANANDYFDANMAMDAAFTACGLETFDQPIPGQDDFTMSEESMALFNDAWTRAIELAAI